MQKENFVLVVTEPTASGKKKLIESILEKFVNKATMVTVPNREGADIPAIREWCKKNGTTFSVLEEEDEDGYFTEMCSFGVFFVSGPTRKSYMEPYRQLLHMIGKPAFIVEINDES